MRSLYLRAYLRYLASTSKPIVLGPFRSEPGFEVLYWLPFLQWALKTYKIAPERCIALSRGGMGVFYPAKSHVDLYAIRGVDAVRVENKIDEEQRKIQKQTNVTAWDRQAASDAVQDIFGLERVPAISGKLWSHVPRSYHLLHPSWMYWLFNDYWDERATIKLVADHCDFAPPLMPGVPEGFNLPDKFVAVRFYERHTFPLHDQVKAIAIDIAQSLASQFPVVLLNQNLFADDHVDLPIQGTNIYQLPTISPDQNFIMQAAVIARAQAFVGTYGGICQWALRYGKPSLSFYTQFTGTAMAHRHLSQTLAARMGVPFECMDIRALRLYEAALRKVEEKVAA
jgi:hypothetical protein